MPKSKPHLLLVCSSGGHFNQLRYLKKFWQNYNRTWVTFNTPQTKDLQDQGEKMHWIYYPTNRHVWNNIRNLFLAFKILWQTPCTHIISTGAAPGVIFIWVGRIFFGKKTIFIDSLSRSAGMSVSAKLNYFMAHEILSQWPRIAAKYKRLKYKGTTV